MQVNAKYGNYINCLEPGDSGSCTQIDNAEWGPYSEPVTVYLVDGGSINNPDVQLIWEELPIGPFCYPGQYPINKQVNNSYLPYSPSEVRQSLLDYGSSYGKLCGEEVVEEYVAYWKSFTAGDIRSLYKEWSEQKMDIYLNGSGSGYSWDVGWKGLWNSSEESNIITTTTTTIPIGPTPTGTLTGDCPLLSSSTAATSPLFKQVNNNVYPFGPVESAFNGYEGCMYRVEDREQIKEELIRYLDYWKQFDKEEFKNLSSVQDRNWRNDSALNDAANRWASEWSNVDSSSIVENLSRSDGQLVWDDEWWTVGVTTTTLPTYSDPTTTNTVLGSPKITSITLTTQGSQYKAVIGFDLAPAVKDLEIVGHSCDYYANPSSGGISGNFGVDTKTCELDVPQREQISFKVAAKYGNYVNCGDPNNPNSTCVQIDNTQYGPYCEWVTVTLTGAGSISDSSVAFSWDGASSTTTTTTVPGGSSETTTTTTTTLPPSNTTTTTVPCKTLDEAKSLWISNNVRLKACQGCVPRNGASRYVVDPSGSTTAQVNGTTQNVSLQPTGELQVGDTFLSGESGDAGLLLWTHTVTVAPVQGSCTSNCGGRAEWTPVYPDSEVERFARGQYEICP